jgi:hypothetical protein
MRPRDNRHISGVHKMDISRVAKAKRVFFASNWINLSRQNDSIASETVCKVRSPGCNVEWVDTNR